MNIRHSLANVCYAVGARLDRPTRSPHDDSDSFGDRNAWPELPEGVSRGQFQIHGDDKTPVAATFTTGSYNTVWLTIGYGVHFTVFPTRPLTRKLLTVLHEVDARYCKYGERRP